MLQYLGLPLAPPLGELASVSETERVSHQNRKRAAARSNVQRPSFAETGKKAGCSCGDQRLTLKAAMPG